MSTKGLGPRGKDALFGSSAGMPAAMPNIQAAQESDVFKEISTLSLVASTVQPRKTFDEANLKELASSIQEKGIVQPIVVRKLDKDKYEIIAGERRFRAAKLLGLETVPTIVREYTDAEIMTIALIENIQREDLNPVEEAEAFATLKETYKLSQEELAKSLGKSRPSIANALRLLNLPDNIRAYMLEGKLSAAHGRTLLALDYKDLLDALTDRIVQYSLSVRDTENLVEYANAYQRLPELTVTATMNPLQDPDSLKTEVKTPKRRAVAKPKTFLGLQKQLRSEVHRGTSISGSLENGKITLPFSGKAEFESLLKLLAVQNFEAIVEDILANEENSAQAEVSGIEVKEIKDILKDKPVDILADEAPLEEIAMEEENILSEDELAMQEAAIEEAALDAMAEEAIEAKEQAPLDEISAEILDDFGDTGEELPEIDKPETGAPVTSGDNLFNVLDEIPEDVETLDDLADLSEEAK